MSRSRRCCGLLLLAAALVSSLRAQSIPGDGAVRSCDASSIVPNILTDQRQIWTFPIHMAKGEHLVPALAFIAATGVLIATDPYDSHYFRSTSSFKSFDSAWNGTATAVGIVLVPVALYTAGLARSDSKAKNTAWLAGEALADSEILAYAIKFADERLKPAAFPTSTTNLSDSWFEKGLSAGSFPSGHAIAAFSVATVMARRYGNHRWVPFVAYGLATAVGFSRISTSAHFPADVFAGAVLGYSVSRFVVLRE